MANQLTKEHNFCSSCGNPTQVANDAKTTQEQPQQQQQPPKQQASSPYGNAGMGASQLPGNLGYMARNITGTNDYTDQFDPEDIKNNKVMGILSYLEILVLIPIFAAKKSAFARFHANQGLVLFIASVIYGIVDRFAGDALRNVIIRTMNMTSIYHLCNTILWLFYLVFFVLAVIGIVNVVKGRAKELPFIGKIRILK